MRVRVVDIARREINAKTDIAFEYEEIKTGRKVTSLRFIITKNARADEPDELRDDPKLARLVSRLVSHGVTEDTARTLVLSQDIKLVGWALAELERRLKAKVETLNPAGWLHDAIIEDWRPQRTLFTEASEAAIDKEQHKADLEANILNIRKLYNVFEKRYLMQYTELLEGKEREEVEQGFRAHLASSSIPGIIAKKFEGGASWHTDPIIKTEAIRYLKAIRPDFSVLPIAKFAEENGAGDFEAMEREYHELSSALEE